ncbi:uncharacterized protein BDZ99DRAFT_81358 [Mytilinidion resinicola]|uniref:Uncharacterized protein n=1 Tax=Mytilinidion resinicola TaxID=574789 RepID=A0A6A6YHS8_9PEZI|nr:uncharacterized protein BDZ99DRAFT_81358 [Mytilinidion resinicola]KAF2807554.1 hypothetical protein BDZ99DRAFT_81358 [Mytilinidion resinicola]
MESFTNPPADELPVERATQQLVAQTSLKPNTEFEGPFSVTTYGASAALEISNVIQDHEPVFTDDDQLANVPEDQWLQIPLVDDLSSAKLAHRVYLLGPQLGPQERALVDAEFDKLDQLHEQGRMEWSGPTRFGFPVFVV